MPLARQADKDIRVADQERTVSKIAAGELARRQLLNQLPDVIREALLGEDDLHLARVFAALPEGQRDKVDDIMQLARVAAGFADVAGLVVPGQPPTRFTR